MDELDNILNKINNIYKNRKLSTNYIITSEKIANEIDKIKKIENRRKKITKLKNIIR